MPGRTRLLEQRVEQLLPHAVPGIIFAIGAVFLALFVLRGVVPLYGTVALIVNSAPMPASFGWLPPTQ